MPIKNYPAEVTREYRTANLRRFSTANCSDVGSSSIIDSAELLSSVTLRQATGWETPGWHKIREKGGLLPFTAWSRYQLHGTVSTGEREWCAAYPNGSRHRWENYYRGGADIDKDATFYLGLVNLPDLQYCVQQAAAAIYSNGFDALTFLAEFNQLRRMLTGVGRKFLYLTGDSRLRDRWWNYWLEGRYGWRTLRYDIQDFSEYLSSVNDGRSRYRQSKGLNYSTVWTSSSDSTSSGLTTRKLQHVLCQFNGRGTVVADIEAPEMRFNPLTTAWEVTRLSFVVDWLFNVGQALEAATFLLLTKQYVAGTGYRVEFSHDVDFEHVTQTAGYKTYANTGHAHADAVVISRSPTTVDIKPHKRLRLDAYKVIDLFALIRQRIR